MCNAIFSTAKRRVQYLVILLSMRLVSAVCVHRTMPQYNIMQLKFHSCVFYRKTHTLFSQLERVQRLRTRKNCSRRFCRHALCVVWPENMCSMRSPVSSLSPVSRQMLGHAQKMKSLWVGDGSGGVCVYNVRVCVPVCRTITDECVHSHRSRVDMILKIVWRGRGRCIYGNMFML